MHPPLAPTVRGLCCPPAPPSDHLYGGLGVSLRDSEAWKPQNVRACGCNRCARNSVFSHVAQDMARSWFWACLTRTAHIQAIFNHFWAVSRTYHGARGQKRDLCQVGTEAHVMCTNRFPSFVCFERGLGQLWAKKGCFGAQNAQFWEGTTQPGATGDFLAQNLDLARPPPRLQDG